MSHQYDVIVVGGGIGGLCAAVLLGARGRRVILLEAGSTLGGKAGVIHVDGVEMDTGPSVLTLPFVFDDVFEAAKLNRTDEIELLTPEPGFRYLYPDGVELNVYQDLDQTLDSIQGTLGSQARREMVKYMSYSAKIWTAAAPHFVMAQAPDVKNLLLAGPRAWGAVAKIDPFSTLRDAIDKRVKSPHLRSLLMRYATYNGSDVRRAPATLGCIAHVELALGGFGVRGGMIELVRALERAAVRVGVEIALGTSVARVLTEKKRVHGVELSDGGKISGAQIVMNGDVAQLYEELLVPGSSERVPEASMSAHNALFRACRAESSSRVAHTVVFPTNYDEEFAAIFDRKRVPDEPTIYLCAQERCNARIGWEHEEPVFAMVNAPPLGGDYLGGAESSVWEDVKARLTARGLLASPDHVVWSRSPADLAKRFPGSKGSLYGAASNSSSSAFQRPSNTVRGYRGLYVASGSAHPGGGVPMVAQSGKLAAEAALRDAKVTL